MKVSVGLLGSVLLVLAVFGSSSSYSFTSAVPETPMGDCSSGNLCIRKCCQLNYYIKNSSCVFSQSTTFLVNISSENETTPVGSVPTYSIVSGIMSCASSHKYRLDPQTYKDEEFKILKDGRLWHPRTKTYVEYDQYCLENFDDINFSAVVCVNQDLKIGTKLNFIGMLISMPFLMATFLVYLLLPEKNLHKNSLMSYVLALFFAYLALVIVQAKSGTISVKACATLGTFTLFFFMASFFWMNIIALDIWWTFSGSRGFVQRVKEEETKRFLQYSAYAWGVPLLMVILVLSLSFGVSPERLLSPGLGRDMCWFKDKITELFYFYGPIAVLIVANIVLFVRTYLQIRSVHQAADVFRNKHDGGKKNFENHKRRFHLYSRLLLAMGLNWSMEFISWVIAWQVQKAPAFLWYLTDFCNALYGVFIFFMFVFKRSIFNSLKARYYMATGKLHLARTFMRKSETPQTTTETSV